MKSWLKPGIMPMIWEKGPIFITFVNCSYLHTADRTSGGYRGDLHVPQGELAVLQLVHQLLVVLTQV